MRSRGFTIIELVVAMAVSAIVLAGGAALLIGTQRLFATGAADRAMQETARVALDEVTHSLRAAGYGLEPTFVFDFGQAPTIMDRLAAGEQARFGGYACADNVTCRDSVAGPDELVFYARDPVWGRDLNGAVGVGSLTLAGSVSALGPGQILQLMCYGTASKWLWAYVTVSQANNTTGQVLLQPGGAQPNDFPKQNARIGGEPCFAAGQRRAFKIDRYRYFIGTYDPSGAPAAWQTPGTRPYLMLDQGLTDANGNPILQVIAADVEDLQVAYVFPLAANPGDQLAGATPGTALDASATGIDLAPALGIPAFSTPSLDPIRTTRHPANIRAVRVAITVRSSAPDDSLGDATVPAALNRPAVAGERGYRRMTFESTVYTHNLETKLPVFPIYDPTYTAASCTAAQGNCGGG